MLEYQTTKSMNNIIQNENTLKTKDQTNKWHSPTIMMQDQLLTL